MANDTLKKPLVTNCEYEELMKAHNPFLVRGLNGELLWFSTYYDAYLDLFERLTQSYPAGWIDPVLCLCDRGVDYWDALRVSIKHGYQSDALFIIEWKDVPDFKKDFINLHMLCVLLHTITNSELNESMFKSACETFFYNYRKPNSNIIHYGNKQQNFGNSPKD